MFLTITSNLGMGTNKQGNGKFVFKKMQKVGHVAPLTHLGVLLHSLALH